MNNFVYNYARKKNVINSNNTKKIAEAGIMALMCPRCFNIVETAIAYSKSVCDILDKIEDFHTVNEYYGTCPNCKESVKFEQLDGTIGRIINILNTKGYYTAFCCEGHIEPDEYDAVEGFANPYIYFYFWDYTDVLKTNPLPSTWYINDSDKECKIFCIRDNICEEAPEHVKDGDNIKDLYKYTAWLKNNWDQKKRLKDIYDWAISLPDRDSVKKEYDRYAINEFGMDILLKNMQKTLEHQHK